MKIVQLPSDYKHPQGFNMGGYYAICEDGHIIVVDKCRDNLVKILEMVK